MASKPLVVFSKSYCPYCAKAKTALKAVGAKYEVSPISEKYLTRHFMSNQVRTRVQQRVVTVSSWFIGTPLLGGISYKIIKNNRDILNHGGHYIRLVTDWLQDPPSRLICFPRADNPSYSQGSRAPQPGFGCAWTPNSSCDSLSL